MRNFISKTLYIVLLIFLVIIGKLFYLQIIDSQSLQKAVVENRVQQIVELPERGEIVDRNGYALAKSVLASDIAIYPNLIRSENHQKNVAKALSETLGVNYTKVLKQAKGDEMWSSVKKRVDYDDVSKLRQIIEEDSLGGIEIKQSPKRYYLNDELGSSFLGFVNYNNEPGAGLELSLNKDLGGTPGYTLAEMDNMGREIAIGFQSISTPVDGKKVTLSIDKYIQYVLEKNLSEAMEEMDAVGIHGVVLDPNNGEVLGMASYPTFDPNDYDKSPKSTWTENVASYVYEPGSTIKPIYMAMALENKSIDTDFISSSGSTSVQGTVIKDWNKGGWGTVGLEDIIVHSSNVGMINISREMSEKQVVDGLKKAGFGKRTGIELPAEEIGLFPSEKSLIDDPQKMATTSFGQGISVTPIQLITAFSEVINGGYDIQPSILRKIQNPFGNVEYDSTDNQQKGDKIYSPEVSKTIREYLKKNMEIPKT